MIHCSYEGYTFYCSYEGYMFHCSYEGYTQYTVHTRCTLASHHPVLYLNIKGYGDPPLYGGSPYLLFGLYATTVGAVRGVRARSYKREAEGTSTHWPKPANTPSAQNFETHHTTFGYSS